MGIGIAMSIHMQVIIREFFLNILLLLSVILSTYQHTIFVGFMILLIAFDVNQNFIYPVKFGIFSKIQFPYSDNLNTLPHSFYELAGLNCQNRLIGQRI